MINHIAKFDLRNYFFNVFLALITAESFFFNQRIGRMSIPAFKKLISGTKLYIVRVKSDLSRPIDDIQHILKRNRSFDRNAAMPVCRGKIGKHGHLLELLLRDHLSPFPRTEKNATETAQKFVYS